ncbi:MAG TPA: D-alanine--poly(phosphoribitol) ligase [Chloroflexi bacterium]|nr:D-alanine--poly(phosphoribitol) ligase [Chloroflexota bacterium]
MAYLLHQLLTESARRVPKKEAVRFEGRGLTYQDLDVLTNQVARTLKAAGVRRGDRVGIYLHKSIASVVSLFGILKAGGVYVPLDPNAPVKRLAYMARNCDIKVMLTSTDKLEALPQFFAEGVPLATFVLTDNRELEVSTLPDAVRLISWDDVRGQEGGALPPPGTIETDLAYILYTSGSTGDPKGVMISHRTIFTFINWCHETFCMTEDDRVTSHAPLHFDLSTFDIYVTIKAGGTIIIVPEKLSIFPIRLVRLLQDEGVTVTYLVPSVLSLMVNYGKLDAHNLSTLRTILFAGEVFPIKYLRRLMAAIPHADYYNLYGPTETNVCTYYKVQAKDRDPERTQPVPIGIACENVEVFAVDEGGQLIAEPGHEGELWVRGSCVAQGYWGDSEKTAKTFVRNPFQQNFDEVAYRTGDIVTLDEDGVNWIYVGRRDHMIKSRGYRIELGEIETVLYSHEAIKEAAVVAVPDDLVGNRLRAFVVAPKQDGLTVADLEAYCSQRVPRYMLPESIEFRDQLPKTSSGKIDRPLLARM